MIFIIFCKFFLNHITFIGSFSTWWCHGSSGQPSGTFGKIYGAGGRIRQDGLRCAHERAVDLPLHQRELRGGGQHLGELRQGQQPDHVPEGTIYYIILCTVQYTVYAVHCTVHTMHCALP